LPAHRHTIAKLTRNKLGKDEAAIEIMQDSLKVDFDYEIAEYLIRTLAEIGEGKRAEQALEKWINRFSPRNVYDLRTWVLEAQGDFDGALNEIRKFSAATGLPLNQNYVYFLLRKGEFHEANKVSRDQLQACNFSLEQEALIVNYEISQKKLKNKVNVKRLEELLKFTTSVETKAAICALLEKTDEMLSYVETGVKENKTFRHNIARWPAFDEYRTDLQFVQVVEKNTTRRIVH
jgi:hypothetical protein